LRKCQDELDRIDLWLQLQHVRQRGNPDFR
jgi:hypothetical protein